MLGRCTQPGTDGVFLHPFDLGHGSSAAPFGQLGQCFHNVFLAGTPPIEDGPSSDGESASASLAQSSLGAGHGMPEVDQVISIHLAVVRTRFMGTEGVSLGHLRFCTHAPPSNGMAAPTRLWLYHCTVDPTNTQEGDDQIFRVHHNPGLEFGPFGGDGLIAEQFTHRFQSLQLIA